MTITEFIEARLEADELAARAAIGGTGATEWIADGAEVYAVIGSLTDPGRCSEHPVGLPNDCDDDPVADALDNRDINAPQRAEHIARHDPARALRQCERDRKVLARHAQEQPIPGVIIIGNGGPLCAGCGTRNGGTAWPCVEVRDLAAVWSAHPDYQTEWSDRLYSSNTM